MLISLHDGRIILYQGDCLEIMSLFPKKSIDMILADLPYGTTRNKWDSILPLDVLWKEYKKICKKNYIIVLTAQTPFDKILGVSNLKELRYELIWQKNKATGHLNAKKAPLKAHENILVFYKKLPVYNPVMGSGKAYSNSHKPGDSGENYGKVKYSSVKDVTTRYPQSIIQFNVDIKADFHPTQKPVALMEYLIKTYTNENDIVLDNTMGSGTTGVACINTNRRFIGIEKDEKYFEIAVNRCKDAINANIR